MVKLQSRDFELECKTLSARPKKRALVYSYSGFEGTYKKTKSNTQLLIEDIDEERDAGCSIRELPLD